MRPKVILPLGLIPTLLLLDVVTKRWALEALAGGRQLELFGGLVPLTLAFNRGAAFGLSIGNDPRWVFIPLALVATVFLAYLLMQARENDWLRIVSTSMVLAGAVGNLVDRVRWERGVVDFIGPVDLGFMLWPIFNVADMAISCGAALLAISFWHEDMELGRSEEGQEVPGEQELA
ncbi:MAG: signal peptidase II [Gemmatimonadota bacterium]